MNYQEPKNILTPQEAEFCFRNVPRDIWKLSNYWNSTLYSSHIGMLQLTASRCSEEEILKYRIEIKSTLFNADYLYRSKNEDAQIIFQYIDTKLKRRLTQEELLSETQEFLRKAEGITLFPELERKILRLA